MAGNQRGDGCGQLGPGLFRASDEEKALVVSQAGCCRQLTKVLVLCDQDSLLTLGPGEDGVVGGAAAAFQNRDDIVACVSERLDDAIVAALIGEEAHEGRPVIL